MQLTLVFCGPHADRNIWSPLYHRIDHAIAVARDADTPLLIAGDAHQGKSVMHFADRAESHVRSVLGAFHPGARTLTDAQAALSNIRDVREFDRVREVLVVTDAWHVRRALAYLRGECPKIIDNRSMTFLDASTSRGPRPPSEVLEGEQRGILDYDAGNPYRPFGEPYGKPAHPIQENCHE